MELQIRTEKYIPNMTKISTFVNDLKIIHSLVRFSWLLRWCQRDLCVLVSLGANINAVRRGVAVAAPFNETAPFPVLADFATVKIPAVFPLFPDLGILTLPTTVVPTVQGPCPSITTTGFETWSVPSCWDVIFHAHVPHLIIT